jgi:hypothetical protein
MIHYGSGNATSVSGSGRAARNGQGQQGPQGLQGLQGPPKEQATRERPRILFRHRETRAPNLVPGDFNGVRSDVFLLSGVTP